MFRKKWIFLVIVFVLLFVFLIRDNKYKDDFYLDVNKKTLDKVKLGDNEYTWSFFSDAQDKSDLKVREIVRNALWGNDTRLDSDIVSKMNKVWKSANDMEKRDKVGIDSLKRYLDLVNDSNNMKDLLDSIILIENDLGVDILTNIKVSFDYKDNSKYIIYFYPVTYFGGTSSDYFVNPDYMAYEAYLKRGMVEILQVYGYDRKKARSIMYDVVGFYKNIGKQSKLNSSLEDVREYYNIISNKSVCDIYNNIDVKYYLERRGIYKYNNYSIVDDGQYKAINDSFKSSNLNLWKNVIILKVLSSYGSFLDSRYVKVIENISNGILGVEDDKSLEDKNVGLIQELFSYDVDFLYSDSFKVSEKKKINDMSNDIINYYKEMLRDNSWLSKDTIDKAILKLDKMKVHIGVERYNKLSVKYDVSDNNLIDSVINILKVNRDYEFSMLDSGNKYGNSLSEGTVNAYYSPLENAIYIPSSIRYLYNDYDSYYQMLGSVGMIIAHEITHAFDTNGSKFDENGNMNNWWSDSDLKKYNNYRDEVIKYYNQYKVINGWYINGEKTVNENIADLGAVACISGIASDNNASKEEIKEMYYSFAKMWASKESKNYTELLLLQDTHSPNKYRVNAVLSSTDLYYKTFGVTIIDKMYKKEKVKVW